MLSAELDPAPAGKVSAVSGVQSTSSPVPSTAGVQVISNPKIIVASVCIGGCVAFEENVGSGIGITICVDATSNNLPQIFP